MYIQIGGCQFQTRENIWNTDPVSNEYLKSWELTTKFNSVFQFSVYVFYLFGSC